MATMPTNFIKQVQLGDKAYELIPQFIQDSTGGAKNWADITSLISGSFQLIVSDAAANTPAGVTWKNAEGTTITGTLAASAAEYPAMYFVPTDLQAGTTDYREYIAVGSVAADRKWELIGRTDIDLSQYSKKTHTHTVTPSSMTIAATAEGAEVQIDTTAAAITGFGAHTTDNALGENATFTTTVTPAKTNISATASGTAVSTSGADKALGEATTFAVSGGALTGATAASFTQGEKASFTQGTFTQGTLPTFTPAVDANGVLTFTFTQGTLPTHAADNFTANGDDSFTANNVGSVSAIGVTANTTDIIDVISGVSVSAQPTITLATGATAGTGVIEVVNGISSATTETNAKDAVAAITALGTATTENVAKAISVKTQPTIKINDKASETVAAATQVSTSAAVEA